jgi:hypothetical protein
MMMIVVVVDERRKGGSNGKVKPALWRNVKVLLHFSR